jgi:hypothetical protein
VRTPCKLGLAASTVTPESGEPPAPTIVPWISPVVWARREGAASRNNEENSRLLDRDVTDGLMAHPLISRGNGRSGSALGGPVPL